LAKSNTDVRLEQRAIWNSPFEQILEMAPVEGSQGFGRDLIAISVASLRDGRLEPPLFDPVRHFTSANMQCLRQGPERKAVAADFTNTELPSLKSVSESLGAPAQSFGDFLNGVFREQFPRFVKLFRMPATVIDLRLDAVLDHEPPTLFLGAAALTLKPTNELGKFVS
jgi:hypothetical protein